MKNTLATIVILSALALQGCVVGVSAVQPPHARYYGHPSLVVIPGTYVYAMTDVTDDIYFHVGWWWRLWDGRWYKSRHYDRGWSHYRGVPVFYREVDPRWRDFYRHRRWNGHPWECERIPAPRVQSDWHRWQDARHWEREKNWGVKGFRPEPYRHAGMTEQERDGSRFREADRHRQVRSQAAPDRRREFSRENETARPGLPFFGNRRTDDREAQSLERDRTRDRRSNRQQPAFDRGRREVNQGAPMASERLQQDRQHTPQIFERQRRDEVGGEAKRAWGDRGQQDSRRNRKPFEFGRQESGDNSQPRREQFRERLETRDQAPLSDQRQREARPERVQRREGFGSQESHFKSRQREVTQEEPQGQTRNRDAEFFRRAPQGSSEQESGHTRPSKKGYSQIMQKQE